MITQLKEGKVDLIIALTEGLVSEIVKSLQPAPAPASTSTATDSKAAPAPGSTSKTDDKKESQLCLLSTYVESPLTWAISTVRCVLGRGAFKCVATYEITRFLGGCRAQSQRTIRWRI
jgi:hypothetical protein